MSKKLSDVDEKLSAAQTAKDCLICGEGGRTVGKLGGIDLNYCGHHRKYGERILNFFIAGIFGDKMKKMLKESKDDLFMDNFPELSEESYEKIKKYVNENIHKLDEINEWYQKTE